MYVSLKSLHQSKNMYICKSFVEKMKLQSPAMKAALKLIQYCCAVTCRADVYWWNMQIANITINCIYMWQGILMLG